MWKLLLFWGWGDNKTPFDVMSVLGQKIALFFYIFFFFKLFSPFQFLMGKINDRGKKEEVF